MWDARRNLPMRHIIAFDPGVDQPEVLPIETLYKMGRPWTTSQPVEFRHSAMAVDAEELATIIYTSGTAVFRKVQC